MSFNLFETVKASLSGDMINKMAGILGESSAHVQQAMYGIIPSVLTGILLKADSGDVQEILNLATEAARIDIPSNLNPLAGVNGNAKGMDFLKNIFGENNRVIRFHCRLFRGKQPVGFIAAEHYGTHRVRCFGKTYTGIKYECQWPAFFSE